MVRQCLKKHPAGLYSLRMCLLLAEVYCYAVLILARFYPAFLGQYTTGVEQLALKVGCVFT